MALARPGRLSHSPGHGPDPRRRHPSRALFPHPQAVLSGTEVLRVFREGRRIHQAGCRIDDSVPMRGGGEDGTVTALQLDPPDPDAAFARALAAGGEVVQDSDGSERRGGVRSPDGTVWWLARKL